MKKVKLLILAVLSFYGLHAQTDNMDFEFGNFDNWTLDVGVRTNPNNVDWNSGVNDVNAQIRIMNPNVPPLDEYGLLCSPTLNIPTSFPSGVFSARIGDNPGGRRAARISRTFTVTPNASYLQYSYAVILEEPGHSQNDQPKFVVNIRDSNGNIVTCGQFEAFAGNNAASQGFVPCSYDRAYRCDFPISDCSDSNAYTFGGGVGFPVQILPWTSGGADLTPFIGQQITIEFISLDCMLGGHGGTAYVEATVEPLEIQVEGLCMAGPNNITLTAPLGFTSYQWSTGETTRSINVIGAEFGDMFSVDLTSNTGCNTAASITLGPVASATIDPIPNMEICEGGNAILSPTGTNVGDFSFPDLGTTGQSAVVSPTSTTTYTVIARDENGCDGESTTVTIDVIPSTEPPFPNADFELEPVITDQANPCNTIQFNNLSGYCKADLTYLWDFGDGDTSTEQNPLHTFPTTNTPMTYYITLTVTSAGDGTTDSETKNFSTSTIAPSFYALEDCGIVRATNTATICGATFDSYPSFMYSWDFGDGTAMVTTDSATPEIDHTYITSGDYTITMTMTDTNSDFQAVVERMVRVTVGLMADFEFYPDCFDVRFLDLSTTCDPIVSHQWDFGDGSPINNEASPTHTYSTIGPHTVTLTVDDGTNILTTSQVVLLDLNTIVPEFNYGIDCNEVTFTDLSSSCDPLTYRWDFGGDNATSTEENPVHIFEYDTNNLVTLTVNDGTQDFVVSREVAIVSEFEYSAPLDLKECSSENVPDSAVFNLNGQSDYIRAEISANGLFYPPVTYYLTASDAEGGMNPIGFELTNTSNPQTIYARVVDSQGCYQTFPFDLSVASTPSVNTLDDISLCYLKENSIGYDLSQLNARAFEGLDQSNVTLTYHETEADGNTNENAVSNISLMAGVDYSIYVRAENTMAPECYTLGVFNARMDNENTDIDDRCMPFFSNTMTPNGDGANDVFFIQNIDTFPNNHLTIYNRWGQKVYETNGYDNNWEGTFKGRPLPVATYYYIMELNDPDNRKHSGYISILR